MVVVPATAAAADSDSEYSAATCSELAELSDNLVLEVLTINSGTFVCDDYTTFTVGNDMTLAASAPVEFKNFALRVVDKSVLTIEPDVSFHGVDKQVRGWCSLNIPV